MAKSNKTSNARTGEMNVYTALLVVAALVLGVGVFALVTANMKQAELGGHPGSPLEVLR
jgi:hypothetical protein